MPEAGVVIRTAAPMTEHRRTLWDISPPVHTGSPVFPGDTPYSQRWAAVLTPRCPVNVSAITLSPHVGAHADAPLHYDPHGAAIGTLPLEPFLGRCRVVHAIGCGALVQWQHIAHAVAGLPPRLLVRTCVRMPWRRITWWLGNCLLWAGSMLALSIPIRRTPRPASRSTVSGA